MQAFKSLCTRFTGLCNFVICTIGSVTLHHWQQLAKPNLGGILDPRPGILTKDFRELEVDLQHIYSLNDLEEDEPDMSKLPDPTHYAMGKDLSLANLCSQFRF